MSSRFQIGPLTSWGNSKNGYKKLPLICLFPQRKLKTSGQQRKIRNTMIQQAGEKNRTRAQAYQQQRQIAQQRPQQKKLDQNTLCAMNTDTNKCVCIHRETGQKISMLHNECVSRASNASNIRRL